MENRTPKTVLILMFCVAAFSQPLFVSAADSRGLGRLIHKKNSLYHRIFVYRRGSIVTLQFGKRHPEQMQTQVNLRNLRQHMLEYTKLAFCGLLYKPEPQRMLVLGLGGGVIPREMHHYFPGLEIHVVEIDPEVPLIAERFFGFREDDKLRVHIADGRMFIKKQLRRDPVPKYDLIILDAFNSDYIPFHLMTKEFLEEVKGVLAEDGVVLANVFYSDRLFDAELKTFLAVFGPCQVFLGARSTNAMLVAPGPTGSTLTIREAVDRAKMLQRKHRLSFNMLTIAKRLRPDTRPDSHAKVLTDDRAPVNWLRKQETRESPYRVPQRTQPPPKPAPLTRITIDGKANDWVEVPAALIIHHDKWSNRNYKCKAVKLTRDEANLYILFELSLGIGERYEKQLATPPCRPTSGALGYLSLYTEGQEFTIWLPTGVSTTSDRLPRKATKQLPMASFEVGRYNAETGSHDKVFEAESIENPEFVAFEGKFLEMKIPIEKLGIQGDKSIRAELDEM